MAELVFTNEVKKLPDGGDMTILGVTGSIDASTFQDFQEKMVAVCSEEGAKTIVDMTGCEYINSTGVGLMVALAGEVRKQDGDMFLLNLTEDVRHTMSLLGLLSLFKEYATVEECIEAMAEPEAEEIAVDEPAVPGGAAAYPKRLRCKGCSSILSVDGAGKYTCPTCSTYLSAEANGKVRVFRPLGSQSATYVLPTDFAWGQPLIAAAEVLAAKFEFDDETVQGISHAMDEIWSNIASQRKDENETCQVMMVGNKQGIVMGFVLYHRKILDPESSQGSILMRALASCTDDVQIKSLSDTGQALRIVMKNHEA